MVRCSDMVNILQLPHNRHQKSVYCECNIDYIAVLVVNYGISNTIVLEIP